MVANELALRTVLLSGQSCTWHSLVNFCGDADLVDKIVNEMCDSGEIEFHHPGGTPYAHWRAVTRPTAPIHFQHP